MQLEPHVEALQAELASLAALGGEDAAAVAERLSRALSATLGLGLLEVLSEAALEVNTQLPAGHLEVRLVGRDPSLVYVEDEAAGSAAVTGEDGLTARITLRLPDSLKVSIEAAAAADGVSVNAWLVRAVGRVLSAPVSRIGNRLTGYGRS